MLWPPDAKSCLTGKDPDAGKDWRREEKGMTEDEMAGWHHWLDGRESEWTPGVGEGQGGLACCSPWGHRELDTTERLDNKTPHQGAGNSPWDMSLLGSPLHQLRTKAPFLFPPTSVSVFFIQLQRAEKVKILAKRPPDTSEFQGRRRPLTLVSFFFFFFQILGSRRQGWELPRPGWVLKNHCQIYKMNGSGWSAQLCLPNTPGSFPEVTVSFGL